MKPMASATPIDRHPADGTDIPDRSWIDRWAPAPTRPYLRLIRADRPIGTWLLVLPCWWGLALAPRSPAPGGSVYAWSDLWLALLFLAGSFVMRGAGCVINDIIDHRIDAQVARTRTRPIPSGQVSLRQAWTFLAALMAVGLVILVQFNVTTLVLGAASLLLVFPYPLMKRITWWPQAFLGLTFNWGALVGWTAVTGSVALPTFWPAVVLYLAGVAWTLGYDTVYAHMDKDDDAKIGVKSTARLFGRRSRPIVAGFYVLAVALLLAAGVLADLSPVFVTGVIMAAAFAGFHIVAWRPDDRADCLRRFKGQKWFGLLVLAGFVLGQVLGAAA